MKTSLLFPRKFGSLIATALLLQATQLHDLLAAENLAGHKLNRSTPAMIDQIAVTAGQQYRGGGLSVIGGPEGARLQCVFQRLEGRVTPQGLWLRSTAKGATGDPFRVVALAAGLGTEGHASPNTEKEDSLPRTGKVTVADHVARFIRPGLTEEYSVSADGVRQDFVITERPAGTGDLRVELALDGTRAEPAAYGAKLTLNGSGRALAYRRLRVVDAGGRELVARLDVLSASCLVVHVAQAGAAYPVRIDPTFSDADWITLNVGVPGANSDVYAVAVDSTGNVYVGGEFTFAGAVPARGVAKWDGTAWSALGLGLGGLAYPYVNSLAVSGTDLYVGGEFRTAGGVQATNIAKWDGSTWSALGWGVNSEVYALAVSGTDLYAGGTFTQAGGQGAQHIAKWDGTAWSAVSAGMDSKVRSLAVNGATVYAGGDFAFAGGVAANFIAKWDGSAWSPLGLGLHYPALALAVAGTNVYAGGLFGILRWDGSAWSNLGAGIAGGVGGYGPYVNALAVTGADLYAGGSFTSASGVAANYIARWNGNSWSTLGSGMGVTYPNYPWVNAMAVNGTNLYVGGYFSKAGESAAANVAKWDGSAWWTLGSGMDAQVFAVAVSGTDLYVGGVFTTAGGLAANHIAKWNGSTWTALGSGISGSISEFSGLPAVSALAVSGTNLYAGGLFTLAGGATAIDIAKWDGAAWSGLGSGIEGSTANYSPSVIALAVRGTDLYVGGMFTKVGGVAATNIAKWDGSAWSALGGGVNSSVASLAVSGTDLYAGGLFTMAGGVTANYVAKWDGSTWSALGSGMNSAVRALAVTGADLYAGGSFTSAGGVAATNIAKWDGLAWSPLGSGIGAGHSFYVAALAVAGTDLYAGGSFTSAGDLPATNIAKWDGNNWSALGSGTDRSVGALAADGQGHLYVGGGFYFAGTNTSPFVAQANVGANVSGGQFLSCAFSPATGFSCTFGGATIGQPYRIQAASSLAPGGWTNLTSFTYSGPVVINDPSAVTTTNKLYRASTP